VEEKGVGRSGKWNKESMEGWERKSGMRREREGGQGGVEK
jgi:hypothetical protein